MKSISRESHDIYDVISDYKLTIHLQSLVSLSEGRNSLENSNSL